MDNKRFTSDVWLAKDKNLSVATVRKMCREGRIVGAFFDRARWRWVIPCPARIR